MKIRIFLIIMAPCRSPMVMDFKSAAFLVPDIECKGCVFHWGQVVWRKAQDLGLRQPYLEDNSMYIYVRKIMMIWVRNSGSLVARGYQNCCRATTIGDSSSPVVYHKIWVTDGLIISAGQVSETTQWLPLG